MWQSDPMFRRHPILTAVTLGYLGVVCWLTLTPSMNADQSSWLWALYRMVRDYEPTQWVTFDGVEFVVNVLLFVPLGMLFLLVLGRRRWWAAILFGILGSCWIELAQYLWLPDRTADVRDVVSNGIGIVIGVVIAAVVSDPESPNAKARARRAVSRSAQPVT